jgi:hypothetical protein
MRSASAVRVTVSPPTGVRGGVALLAALAAASGAAWATGHAGLEPTWGLLALAPGAVLGWALGPHGDTDLAWDGQRWHCDGQPGAVAVHLDLQRLLLLRWKPATGGAARWLVSDAAAAGPHWHALRVALFAGRPEAPTDAAGQPPLTP